MHDLALLSVATTEALRALHISPTSTVPRSLERITALLIDNRGNRRLEFGTVLGWDASLPQGYNPNRQTQIQVSLDVEPGDSGSAVVDDEGRLLGMVQQRTVPGSIPAFVSLIPADAVRAFAAEGLSPAAEPGLQKS
jgi:S1-C subfamily serine protease